MVESFIIPNYALLLLMLLILSNEALIEQCWGNAKLELILLNLFVKEFYYLNARSFILCYMTTETSRLHLVLLQLPFVSFNELCISDKISHIFRYYRILPCMCVHHLDP